MRCHIRCFVWPEQILGMLNARFAREPAIVVLRVQDDRHTCVDGFHQFVWIGRDDGVALKSLAAIEILPGYPEACECKRLPIA